MSRAPLDAVRMAVDKLAPPVHAVDADTVLKGELREYIGPRRTTLNLPEPGFDPGRAESAGDMIEAGAVVGLALSGGGIRSAAFNLGVLQALAYRDKLKHCDYLSTVSGGGYIGSCLSSLLSSGHAGVEKEAFPLRWAGDRETDEVSHIRQHGNYLAPRHGLLRGNTWHLAAAYIPGLCVSFLTVAACLALVASLGIILYPQVFDLLTRLPMVSFPAPGDSLWSQPHGHWRLLFLPCGVALGFYVAGLLVYFIRSGTRWTIGVRRTIDAIRGKALMYAVVLGIAGALPFAFFYTEKLKLLPGMIAAFGAASLPLARVRSVLKATLERGVWLKRGVTLGTYAVVGGILFFGTYAIWWGCNYAGWVALASVAWLLLWGVITDINRVSFFYFYRDRLSEAFVIKRDAPDRPPRAADDVTLENISQPSTGAPYHLINTAVNLPGSTDPTRRSRRADLFLLSPLYCGSAATGYVPTSLFEGGGIPLASAMAVSGAATNPQAGLKANPALGFLMAMFNVRLGVWSENPARLRRGPVKARPRGRFWPWYLFKELFSLADEKSRYISLSDGGHIENTGIYELLRRRCPVIIASDASADASHRFEDLGTVIRRARIDLGVQIFIDVEALVPSQESGLSKAHVAVGTILYPRPEGGYIRGQILYCKAALTRGDPQDLHEYRKGHATFPHQSTIDQFFDEPQFESYRELGFQSGDEVVAELLVGSAGRG